jgi:hypothetical protein
MTPKAKDILEKLAALPKGFKRPMIFEVENFGTLKGLGGFHVPHKDWAPHIEAFKKELKLPADKLEKAKIEGRGLIVTKKHSTGDVDRFVLRHELSHGIRSAKGKASSKYYKFLPFNIIEESAASMRALRHMIPPSVVRAPIAVVAGTAQAITQRPYQAAAFGLGALALANQYDKHHEKTSAISPLVKVLVPVGAAALAGWYTQNPEAKAGLRYGKYVAKHKFNVVKPMRTMGLGWGQTLGHDLSKLKPSEFAPYRDWFEGPAGIKGTRDPETYKTWRAAVQKHYHSPGNLHHYRALGLDQTTVPLKYKMEAVADWYSVSRSRGLTNESFPEWYGRLKEKLPIAPETKKEINTHLGLNKEALAHELTMAIQAIQNHPKVISTIQRIKNVPQLQKAVAKAKEFDEVGKTFHPYLRRAAIGAQVAGNAAYLAPFPHNVIPYGTIAGGAYLGTAGYSKTYMTNPKFKALADTIIAGLPK